MRLNRLAQIGLIVIVGAVLLWLGLRVFGTKPAPVVEANANAANSASDANVVPVSANPEGQPPRSRGRGYKARFDIPDRTILTRDMFQDGSLDPAADNDKFVTDFLTEGYSFITAKPISKGRHLQDDDLLGSVRELGVSAAVHDGFRAVTIAIPNKPTLHDIVSIGDNVDVVATFDQVETRVLADGVKVLAVDVYGRDYEKAPVAKRGNLSAGPNPPAHPDPNATPVPGQPPVPEGEPQPTPAPQGNQPPPAAREAALTLEVTPEQAAAISLATASGAVLDYLIQPRPSTMAAPQASQTRLTRVMVAPYAESRKRSSGSAPAQERVAKAAEKAFDKIGGSVDKWTVGGPIGPGIPIPGTPTSYPTSPPAPKPKTYDIVIYPDGLPPRVNTVPIPK